MTLESAIESFVTRGTILLKKLHACTRIKTDEVSMQYLDIEITFKNKPSPYAKLAHKLD